MNVCSCIVAWRWVLKMRTIIVLYEMWHASLTSNVHISWFAWDLLSTPVHANVQVYDVRHILTSACFVCFLYIGTCHLPLSYVPCISHPVFGTKTYLGFSRLSGQTKISYTVFAFLDELTLFHAWSLYISSRPPTRRQAYDYGNLSG